MLVSVCIVRLRKQTTKNIVYASFIRLELAISIVYWFFPTKCSGIFVCQVVY